jgi:CheY-like chemotaxis protein
MPGGGVLRFATDEVELDAAAALRLGASPGEYVVLTVADSGCGMDAETKARLFEPFFTTKDLGRGTGLGLATVYGIVTQSDGAISVESEPGRGTTFRVYLPRTAASRPEEAVREEHSARGAETLLLVEDEEVVRRLLADMLRKQGYRVVVADGPDAALDLHAAEGRVDLLVTDVVMPVMNGRELAARLRRRDPGLKVLYVSGYAADAALTDAAEDGCGFLQKPFSLDALAARVRALLDGGPSIAAAA